MPKLTKMPKIKETLRSISFYKIDPPAADLRRISSFSQLKLQPFEIRINILL